MKRIVLASLVSLVMASVWASGLTTAAEPAAAAKPKKPTRTPDSVYVGTPYDVVARMLQMAGVKKNDVVYDLGCGDGRIVVLAGKRYGCRGFGYDIDPQRVAESLANVAKNKVGGLVTIDQEDIFTLDFSQASVVTLYLLPHMNVQLIPQFEKLKPGARIVAQDYGIEGVTPDKVINYVSNEDNVSHKIMLFTTPLKKEN
jgi:SAM-dependent methyltransferase